MFLDINSVLSYISVMTEIKEKIMPHAIEQFILYWGDMGGHS